MPGVVTAGRLVDDRYRLVEALDEGGMGILWRAEDLITERDVLVKELRFPDPLDHMQRRALAARVRREARAMAAVHHPGLARIVDVVDDGDRPWVVTELIGAPTLVDRITADGPMAPERAALLGIRLLEVLEAARDQDMVHRFLQPAKVFISAENDVRVADFGIASLIGDPTVASTGSVGGVSFMAPEQAGTPEADVWSLGAVLYYAVEGVPPFDGPDSGAILAAIATAPPRPPVQAGALSRVLELALQKDPSERPSGDELRTLLEVAAGPLAPRPDPDAEPDLAEDRIVWADHEVDHNVAMDLSAAPPEAEAEAQPAEQPAGPAEPTEPAEPPEPLPPRVALERMFFPDPGSPPFVFTPKDDHREPPPPWPVARKPRLWITLLCGLVTAVMIAILVTNGRDIFNSRTHAARTIASVTWAQYVDPATGFKMDYPADWLITREGNYTDFRQPQSAAALRVVAQDSTATSAMAGWLDLEKRFAVEQSSYSRIRLEPKDLRNLDAAEWEFTYNKSGVPLHNIDLGVVTGAKSFALNFETRASNWDAVRPLFQRFESSFHPPAP
jgi:serine/threonine protein kinase